jgi:ABC-2 type transport system permease protein
MILDGSLDNILIKPMNSFVYLVGSHFEIGGFSHIIAGGIIFFKFNYLFGVKWNVKNIIFYIIAILCASIVQAAITVIIGSCAFFIEQNEGLRRLYEGFRQFIYFPATIYNKFIQVVLFSIIPLAFATFVPAALFLNNPVYDIMSKSSWLLLLIGVTSLLSVIAVGVFNFGLSHYKSSGT